MLPSRISFWLFRVPVDTDTTLKRSNINCGGFLCGATAVPQGKCVRWNCASCLILASLMIDSGRPCGPSGRLSSGMASDVTQLCRRARTSQRHRAPADISGGEGLRSAAARGPVIRAIWWLWLCPSLCSPDPGRWWQSRDWWRRKTQRRGVNDPGVTSLAKKKKKEHEDQFLLKPLKTFVWFVIGKVS